MNDSVTEAATEHVISRPRPPARDLVIYTKSLIYSNSVNTEYELI